MLKKLLSLRIPVHKGDCTTIMQKNSRTTGGEGCYFVKLATFQNLDFSGNGGAFYIQTSATAKVNIYDTTFSDCSAETGGAFYIYCLQKSILHAYRVCGNKCSSTTNNNFCFSKLNALNYENSLSLSSINHCSDDEGSGSNTVMLNEGTVYCNQINLSQNMALKTPAFSFSGKTQNMCNLATIVDNNAGVENIVTTSGAKLNMKRVNFIENNQQKTSTSALISITSDEVSIIEESIFRNSYNYSFISSDQKVQLIDVYIFNFTVIGSIFTECSTHDGKDVATYSLEHYKADKCHADNGVTRSWTLEIVSLTMICLFVVLLITVIVLCCIGNKSKMIRVYKGELPESLYD